MPNREKVIKALECCHIMVHDMGPDQSSCGICPYKDVQTQEQIDLGGIECIAALHDEVLALLKEQEVVSAHWDDDTGHWIEGDRDGIDPHTRTTGEMIDTFRCSWCGFYLYFETPFCPNCGAKMKGR
mgnify:CR=1 FL=1